MQPRKPDDPGDDPDLEQREYSSPACFLHEFEPAARTVVIYHNPACSKSRETLALIQASGISPKVIEYLKTPPGEAELMAIVDKLGLSPLALVRTNEAVFRKSTQARNSATRSGCKRSSPTPSCYSVPLSFVATPQSSGDRRRMSGGCSLEHQGLTRSVAEAVA